MSTIKQLQQLTREELCQQFVNKFWYGFARVEPDCFELVQSRWIPALRLWKIMEPDELVEAMVEGEWSDKELRRFYQQFLIWDNA